LATGVKVKVTVKVNTSPSMMLSGAVEDVRRGCSRV
jgi:hypothetical protein